VSVTRRAFLVAAAAGAVAGCSGASRPRVATTTTSTTGLAQLTGDLALAARAAAWENTLAAAYGSVLGLDRLGAVPVGLKGLWETFQSHHRDHALAWNAILTAAGDRAVTTGDAAFSGSVVTPGLAGVKDVAGAMAFVAGLEQTAAATYLAAVTGRLSTPGALQTAAAIQPIELQHLAILAALTGSDPVPASFASAAGALSP
jgi:ferritin-like protein